MQPPERANLVSNSVGTLNRSDLYNKGNVIEVRPNSHSRTRLSRTFIFAVILVFVVFFVGYFDEMTAISSLKNPVSKSNGDKLVNSWSSWPEIREDTIETNIVDETIDNDSSVQVPDPMKLLENLISAKEEIEAKVRLEYGKYFDYFFKNTSLSEIVKLSEPSLERLINIMQVKILSAQLYSHKTTFVWSTGGHSAAAGHGNLFSQTYSAVLEDTVKDVFASLNISFTARNHAMGGYPSAPELACCLESIFGLDTDILSWDFGMTDGRDTENMVLWANRAGILRQSNSSHKDLHPMSTFLFFMNGPKNGKPSQEFDSFESQGLGLGWLNTERKQQIMQKNLPDFEGWTDEDELNTEEEIPRAVKYLMCGGWPETKIPPCDSNKWNTSSVCASAKFQTNWHPGWKAHLLTGRLLGFFLIETLTEAMESFQAFTLSNASLTTDVKPTMSLEYLDYLYSSEKSHQKLFSSSPPPKMNFGKKFTSKDFAISNNILYRSHSTCHTALLPSMYRYDQIRNNASDPAEYIGCSASTPPPASTNGESQLYVLYDPYDIQSCAVTLNIDHKDYFMARHEDGLVWTKLPKDPTVASRHIGTFMICQPNCPWDKCSPGSLQLSSMNGNNTDISITIDGEKAKGVRQISKYCHILENMSGDITWGPGKLQNGQYKIGFRVGVPNSQLQISSIVVW